jgi:hypothetical protein
VCVLFVSELNSLMGFRTFSSTALLFDFRRSRAEFNDLSLKGQLILRNAGLLKYAVRILQNLLAQLRELALLEYLI